MTSPGGNVTLVVASLVLGWAALWHARRALGGAYHLLALPAGLLAWPLVLAAAAAARRGFGARPFALGAALLIAVCWAALPRLRAPREGRTAIAAGPLGFAATAGAVLGAALALQRVPLTASGYDSLFHYGLPGVWLHDTGRLTAEVMGAYSPLIPAVHAAGSALGAEWVHAAYPLLAATVLALLAYAGWRWAFPVAPSLPRALAAAGLTALLASIPAFVFHSFYVHSHMVSAAYLLGSLVAIRASEDARDATSRRSLLAVAGLMGAGLALARPDGLAYAFVLIAVAAVPSVVGGRPRDAASFLAPPALVLGVVYATAYARLGVWGSHKLPGSKAAAMLGALSVVGVVWLVAASWPALRRVARSERRVLMAGHAALVLAVAGVAALRTEGFVRAGANAGENLFRAGGYGYLWYSILGLLVLTLAFPSLRRAADWSPRLLFALAAFFAVGLAVHGATHPGRVSVADSFNRVAFHAVPVFIWYLGVFVGAAWSSARGRKDTVIEGPEEAAR